MKKLVLFAVLLLVMLPYPIDAFGSYTNDQLNTTNTEQNITFNISLSEIVWVTINRNVNVSSMSWFLTGIEINDSLYQETYNATGNTSESDWVNVDYTRDGDWTSAGRADNTKTGFVYFNYTKPDFSGRAKWQVKYAHDPVLDKNHTVPNLCFDEIVLQFRFFSDANLPYGCELTCYNGTDWAAIETITGQSVIQFSNLYEEAVWWEFYTENVTIDINNNGIVDYVNNTRFRSNETIVFNSTGLETTNTYLHNICTEDWTTGTCDVSINISAAVGGTEPALEISNISVIGEYITGIYNVSVFDELSEEAFNITEADSVLHKILYPGKTVGQGK